MINKFSVFLVLLLVLTLRALVPIRQQHKRFLSGEEEPSDGIVFNNVTRVDCDKSAVLAMKYLFNYGFYKFGFEVKNHITNLDIKVHSDLFLSQILNAS